MGDPPQTAARLLAAGALRVRRGEFGQIAPLLDLRLHLEQLGAGGGAVRVAGGRRLDQDVPENSPVG